MLRFFRLIRKKLIEEDNARKYFFYAIGEIVLVVVGILIALQINNWNEANKQKALEVELLTDLKENLKSSRADLIAGRTFNQQTYDNLKIIRAYIEEDKPYDAVADSAFDTIINWHSPFFTYTAYESLKAIGLDKIEHDSLKNKISALYEFEFGFLVGDYDRSEWRTSADVVSPQVNKHIRYREPEDVLAPNDTYGLNDAYPIDFEALKKDEQFLNMVSQVMGMRIRGIQRYTDTITKLDELILLLEQELGGE